MAGLAAAFAVGVVAVTAVTAVTAAPPVAAAAQQPLHCRLSGPARVVAGQPVVLQFELRNQGAEPLDVLVWATPFEARWTAPFVGIQRDGVELPYRGAAVKRGDPSAADYLRIGAAMSLQASVDLSAAFDVTQPGRYVVQPRLALHDVVTAAAAAAAPAARPRDLHRGAVLDCNALAFDVGG